jgi:hypothetical protein
MSLSRRERREYAKQLGLLSKKENYQSMVERFKRSNQAGEFLHTHHLQEIKNYKNSEEETKNYIEENKEEDYIPPYAFLGKK